MTSWTKPPTWVSDDYVTAAQFEIIGRNLEFLKDRERVHCYHSQDEEFKDSQWEVLRWDSDLWDNNSMHSNHRIGRNYGADLHPKYGSRDGNWPATATRKSARVVAHHGGFYCVIAKVVWKTNSTGVRKIMLRRNSDEGSGGGRSLGQTIDRATTSGPTSSYMQQIVELDRGDHVNLFAWQSSTTKIDVSAGKDTTFLQVFQLSG